MTDLTYSKDKYYISFVENLQYICDKYSESEAITYMLDNGLKESIKYKDISNSIRDMSQLFNELKLQPGDRVAVIAPSMPNTFITCLALANSNITTVMIDATLPEEEISRLIVNADVRAICTIERIYISIKNMLQEEMPVINIDKSFGRIMLFEAEMINNKKKITEDGCPEVMVILYSSGTTSSMKGVMITYQSVMDSKAILADIYCVKERMTYLDVLPLNHIAGYDSTMMFFLSGCNLGMIENVNASKLHKGFLEYNPHYFGMVPKVYDVMAEKIMAAIREKGKIVEFVMNSLLKLSGFFRKHWNIKLGKVLFKPIYSKVFGKNIWGLAIMGTICKEETAKLFLNMGIEWGNLYALTEVNGPISSTGVYDHYPLNSVGKVDRHKNIEIRIKNPNESGIGEVQVKSSLIMKGYFRDPDLTAKSFEDGYFKTGDLGYIDNDNYLFITGRVKETIILHNGEKVSVNDVDEYYEKLCPNTVIASCGIKSNKDFEEIHLFIEKGALSSAEVEEYRKAILAKSAQTVSIYKLAEVHIVDKIPLTSVGKVKRYLLKDMIEENSKTDSEIVREEQSTAEDVALQAIKRIYTGNETINKKSKLKDELGLDSLNLFEICTEIETKFNVNIVDSLDTVKTVGDLIEAIENNESKRSKSKGRKKYDIAEFPREKIKKDINFLNRFKKLTMKLWDFQVVNAEVVLGKNKYILCPNHESYFDSMWVVAALQTVNIDIKDFCCMAAEYLLNRQLFKKALRALGGIPVDRTGNSVPATERALECLKKDKCILLIHPEGTRTRNGEMGSFKMGAAKLAIEAQTEIIPVCIKGAYEIYPPSKKLPRIGRRKGSKYPLKIVFGNPICVEGKKSEEITTEIRNQIEDMKGR